MTPQKKKNIFWTFLQLTNCLLAFLCFTLLNSCHNTLRKNGQWVSSKENLRLTPMDASQFMEDTLPLAQSTLNLGAWHGHQEIFLKEKIHPKKITITFLLNPEASLTLLFNSVERHAVRFSLHPRFPSAYLQLDPLGGFKEKNPFKATLYEKKWNKAELFFNQNGFDLYLNDQKIYSSTQGLAYPFLFGLRGNGEASKVDSVLIENIKGEIWQENFKGHFLSFKTLIAGILLLALIDFILLQKIRKKSLSYDLLALKLALSVLLFLFLLTWHFSFSSSYLASDEEITEEDDFQQHYADYFKEKRAEIMKTIESLSTQKGERLLFLGSSQTWGEGASEESLTWPRQFCARRKEFLCLNAALRAARSQEVLEFYQIDFIRFKPQTVIISLGNNDYYWSDSFKINIEKIIHFNQDKKIKTILIMEPNSPEEDTYSLNHRTLIELGKLYQVPVFNAPYVLWENEDQGFLWWDFIHLSDIGQKILANAFNDFYFTLSKQ